MGIDAEGVLLEESENGWKICSWAIDLPRTTLGPKYSLLSHLTEDDPHLPLLCLSSQSFKSNASRCDALSPSYQKLKILPGDVADVLSDQYDWSTAEAHEAAMMSMFYAHGLDSYARSLLHFLKSLEVQMQEVKDAHFWEGNNYGALLIHALRLGAYGSLCSDLSQLFCHHAATELRCEGNALVGRVELHFDRWIDHGSLWLFEDENSEKLSFTGEKVVLDIGCRKLGRLVFDQSQGENLLGWCILAPPAAPDDRTMEVVRCWFRQVLLCLRRRLPQVPTRRVVEFVRPCFPQRPVALGLEHDHINWFDMEWRYETPNFELLMSCEKELIDLVKQLQSYGCPFQLPFWLQLDSSSSGPS